MNFVSVCAQTTEAPREVYVSATSTALRCNLLLPPVGNKAATPIELNIYGKAGEKISGLSKNSLIFIHGSKLRYDIDTRTFSLHGGVITKVDETFPLFNTVILSGRCVKDIHREDERAFKTTADGLMICNQTLSVNTGRNQADLFNFYAINTNKDKLNNAELLVNFTRKGVGLTINGRLVTDEWTDSTTKERKHATKIQLINMTLAPKPSLPGKEITPQTTVQEGSKVTSLWGGKTLDDNPWNDGGLPDLPGNYGSAPDLENAPF
jgi:single-stranded DNA-binding protein